MKHIVACEKRCSHLFNNELLHYCPPITDRLLPNMDISVQ